MNAEQHMTEDELSLQSEQFDSELALLRHKQAHETDPSEPSDLVCDECGNEIAELRRRALPGVKLCIECAVINEKRLKQWN